MMKVISQAQIGATYQTATAFHLEPNTGEHYLRYLADNHRYVSFKPKVSKALRGFLGF